MGRIISNHMSVTGKIAAIILAFMVPIAVLLTMYAHQMGQRISFTEKEIHGADYLSAVWPLVPPFVQSSEQKAPPLSHATLDRLTVKARQHDEAMRTGASSKALIDLLWDQADDNRGTVAEKLSRLAAVRRLIGDVGDGSNLILDPDLDSYYLMSLIVERLPRAAEAAARLFEPTERGDAFSAQDNQFTKASILIRLGQLRIAAAEIETAIDAAERGNPASRIAELLQDQRDGFLASSRALETVIALQLLKNDTVDASAFNDRAIWSAFSESLDALWQASHRRLVELLEARASAARMETWLTYSLAGFALVGAFAFTFSLRRSIERDFTDKESALTEVSLAATTDPLTGLLNRKEYRRLCSDLLVGSRNDGRHVALLVIDLDRFKAANDNFGHAVGDAVLIEIAHRLRMCLRGADLIARFGGDEFAVAVAVDALQPEDIERVAERVTSALNEPYVINGQLVPTGATVGVAKAGLHGRDFEELLHAADAALYAAKALGRGTHSFFDDTLSTRLMDRRALAADLTHAIERNELEVYLQPIVNLAGGGMSGVECLMRWNHPKRGFVSPDVFIALAEENGEIARLGAWMVRESCRIARLMPSDMRFAINLSTIQLRRSDVFSIVSQALADSGIEPSRLELEVTESIFLGHDDAVLTGLRALHKMGVRLALDDFGTGYSSLGYLTRLSFSKIKIDKLFVRTLNDPIAGVSSRAVIAAIVSLARALDMDVTAEGIETDEQRLLVMAAGCNQGQGYFFCKPVPASVLAMASLRSVIAPLGSAA